VWGDAGRARHRLGRHPQSAGLHRPEAGTRLLSLFGIACPLLGMCKCLNVALAISFCATSLGILKQTALLVKQSRAARACGCVVRPQIGGVRAPSPVGELGNVEMTQALPLADAAWRPVGPDMLLSGASYSRTCLSRSYHMRVFVSTPATCLSSEVSALLAASRTRLRII